MNKELSRKLDEAAYQWVVDPDNDLPRYNRDFIDGALYMHTELISVINDLMAALTEVEHWLLTDRIYQGGHHIRVLELPHITEALAKAKEAVGK